MAWISRSSPLSPMPSSSRNSAFSSGSISAISSSICALTVKHLRALPRRRSSAPPAQRAAGFHPCPRRPRQCWRRRSPACRSAGTSRRTISCSSSVQGEGAGGLAFLQMRQQPLAQFHLLQLLLVAALHKPFWPFPPGGCTVSRSAKISSSLMVSMSRAGSTVPSTWMMFSSSKQRTTCTMASHFPDVGQELVAQSLALAGALHQTGDVHKFDGGRGHFLGMIHLRQHVQPLVRAQAPRRRWVRWCRKDNWPPGLPPG